MAYNFKYFLKLIRVVYPLKYQNKKGGFHLLEILNVVLMMFYSRNIFITIHTPECNISFDFESIKPR